MSKNSHDMQRAIEEAYHLFHGELSDAPGRNESWDDYLRYRGNGRWELITESTDWSGAVDMPISKERMSTRKLVNWVIERDDELDEVLEFGSAASESPDESDEDEPTTALGPHAERLREIAVAVNADYCVKCLDGWVSGTWPKKRRAMAKRKLSPIRSAGPDDPIYKGSWGITSSLGSVLQKMRAQQPTQNSDSPETNLSTGASKGTSATKSPDGD